MVDAPGRKDDLKPVTDGEVRFQNSVSFSLFGRPPGPEGRASFAIPPGHTVAVVGTLRARASRRIARLLFRFYDVTGGSITIDGHDLRVGDTGIAAGRAIGVVPQDTVLFNDSIGYNIGYGSRSRDARADRRGRRAGRHGSTILSRRLPEGYDTQVGERGLKLSGGEKQRVAIARTILKNPEDPDPGRGDLGAGHSDRARDPVGTPAAGARGAPF